MENEELYNFIKFERIKGKRFSKEVFDCLTRAIELNPFAKEFVQQICKRKIGVFDRFSIFYETVIDQFQIKKIEVGFCEIEIDEYSKCYKFYKSSGLIPYLIKIFEPVVKI